MVLGQDLGLIFKNEIYEIIEIEFVLKKLIRIEKNTNYRSKWFYWQFFS